ncbi:MAG: hypothetical protein ACFFBI_12060 [Promethearchaeota archaeon]
MCEPLLSRRYNYKLNLEIAGAGTRDNPYSITTKSAYQDKINKHYLEKKKYTYEDLKNNPSSLEMKYTLKGYKISPTLNTSTYNNGLYSIILSDSNSFLEIKYVYLKSIELNNCKNITISDDILEDLMFNNCSNISIQDVHILNQLKLLKSYEIKVFNSYIYKLDALACDKIIVSNCSIEKI